MNRFQSYSSHFLYLNELKKEKKEKLWRKVSLTIFIISLFTLLLVYALHFTEITGLATYINSGAGYITETRIHTKIHVSEWGGFYGFALSVSGVTEQFYEDLDSGTVTRSDVFFDCLQQDAVGGPEL